MSFWVLLHLSSHIPVKRFMRFSLSWSFLSVLSTSEEFDTSPLWNAKENEYRKGNARCIRLARTFCHSASIYLREKSSAYYYLTLFKSFLTGCLSDKKGRKNEGIWTANRRQGLWEILYDVVRWYHAYVEQKLKQKLRTPFVTLYTCGNTADANIRTIRIAEGRIWPNRSSRTLNVVITLAR